MQSRNGKWLIGGGLLIALAAVGGFTFYTSSKKVEYITARIERGDIDATISATGNCNAVVTVQVGSQVSGNILELHADFNTKVKKNQLVARIDPAPFQAKVDQAKANLDSARSSVLNAQSALKKTDSDIASANANIANQKANVVRAQSAVNDAKTKLDRRLSMQSAGILSKEDLDTAQATYDQAVANLDAVKAQVTAAQDALESTKAQREVAQAQVSSAQSQVKQQQANLQQSQLDLDHTEIRAPVDGTVIARNMDVGQTVAASFSAPTIFQIAQDLTKMQVDANIDESDIGRVKLDQPVTFTVDAYPGQVFMGSVTQIRQAPINVQNVITYDVVIHFDNSDLKLFPGMTANVRILTDRQQAVLKLPNAALRFRPADAAKEQAKAKGGGAFQGGFDGGNRGGGGGGGRGGNKGGGGGGGQAAGATPRAVLQPIQTVYVLGPDGKPQPQRVRLGIGDGNFVTLLGNNLKEGDLVITGISSPGTKTTGGSPFGPQQQGGNFKNKGF